MILEYIKLSVRELLNNKLRSFLSLIGIVIGVAVVFIILSMNDIANAAITNQIAGNGGAVNINYVQDKSSKESIFDASLSSNFGGFSESSYRFDATDADKLKEIEGIKDAYLNYNGNAKVISKSKELSFPIKKDQAKFVDFYELKMLAGKKITDYPEDKQINAVMIGEHVADFVFDKTPQEVIGKTIQINNRLMTVVGVFAKSGKFGNEIVVSDKSYDLMFSAGTIQYASIKVKSGYDLDKITNVAVERLNEIHGTTDKVGGFAREDLSIIFDQIKGVTTVLSIVMSAIGSISLLVAGIGVMNIMLVSVVERTREIGVKRALGASKRAIQFQFMVESSLLTLLGGMFGIIIGVIVISITLAMLKMKMPLNLFYISAAILFSISLGLVFGYLPARRAANLNIIEAIQSE